MTATSTLPATKLRRAPLPVSISAWAVPALVLSGFALVAVVPVTVLVVSAFRNAKARGCAGTPHSSAPCMRRRC